MATARSRVGIKEVAAAAGVSATTVSHSLNGKGRIPAATRERVRQIAEELGYRPSSTARNLVDGRTGLLGLTVAQAEGLPFALSDLAYFVQLTTAATTAAMRQGYALVVDSGAGGQPFSGVDIDGAIVVDPLSDDPLVRSLRRGGVPCITTGRVLGGAQAAGPWVDNDHVRGTRAVLDHLARRGAQRIGLVTSQPDTSFTYDTERAYHDWCTAHDMAPLLSRADSELSTDAAARAAAGPLDAAPPADAIYATLDRLALATFHQAQLRGLAIPGDLLIVSATDSEAARWAHPSLSVINLHPDKIGRQAADMLIELVEGRELTETHVTVPSRIVPRASTRRRAAAAAH